MKRHAFHTVAQPPLCGQKDRRGGRYLPAGQTTTDSARVTCGKCFRLLLNSTPTGKRELFR